MTDAREVRSLVADRPALEPALESLLETDDAHDTWTFDDTGLDSGAFGELVSEGVVEKVDGEYRLADRAAVERALAGEVADSDDGDRLSVSLPAFDIDNRVAAALTGALLLVFVFRILAFDAIFRDGQVVLSGNDPYFYLYWTEELSRQSAGVLDLGVLTAGSFGLLKGEPLLVAVLWVGTELVGGIEQAPLVLAWYPVVAGLLSGLFVYLLANGLTDDKRVGIASVVMLAVMPVLAFRSGLGYADHHAFDYVWLSLTAAGAVRLARTSVTREAITDRRTLGWAAITGTAIAAQLHAWDAGPLLLFPLVLYVTLAGLVSLDRGESPALTLAPLGTAFATGAVLTAVPHLALGWQTTVVASAPLLLLVGTIGVAAAGEGVRRLDDLPTEPVQALAALQAAGALVAFGLLTTVLSTYGNRLFAELGRVGTRGNIVEGKSLFATDSFGWLFLFGLLLFVGVPYMGWAVVRATRGEDRHGWLLVGGYGWSFLLLAVLQRRFAGELSLFLAVFAGLGFVHLAERVDLARPPIPFGGVRPARSDGGDREPAFELPSARDAAALLFLFLLLSGLSIAQAPVKAQQVTATAEAYETAAWIDEYAAAEDMTHPENYVFTPWGKNRFYNYHVNGQSRSYGFALANYESFASSSRPDQWYERLRGKVGFVVFIRTESDEATIYNRLTSAFGSRYKQYDGSGHYRVLYLTDTHQVHQVVPGANVTGRLRNASGPRENATAFLRTQVSVSGYQNPYVRKVTTDSDGRYHVRVAYPGEYEIDLPGSNSTKTVTVSEAAVENGDRVDAGTLRSGNATTDGQARLRPHQVSPS